MFYLRVSVIQAVEKKEEQNFLEKQRVITIRTEGEGSGWEGAGKASPPGR